MSASSIYTIEVNEMLLWLQLQDAEQPGDGFVNAVPAPSPGEWDGNDGTDPAASRPAPWASPRARTEPPLRDPSTGAGTLDALERDLRLDRGRLYGGAFSVALIDIHPLSEIRRHYGDDAAEAVMRALVEAAPFVLRGGDRIYRAGPEHLALLLPASDLTGAASLCLRLQAAVKDVLVRRELPQVMLSARPFERAA